MTSEAIVIIGGGPAGIAAALELRRQGYDPVILEKDRLGGLLFNANRVDNYPGFPDGIDGLSLADSFRRQAEQKNVRVLIEEVTGLDVEGDMFIIESNKGTMRAEYVIVASGTKPNTIDNIAASDEGHQRVFHEVYPIRDIQGRRVAIIGAGDAAFDYALNLARNNEVIILNRNHKSRCAPHLWEKAARLKSIIYHERTTMRTPFEFKDGQLVLQCESPRGALSIHADYLLIAIGRTSRLDFIREALRAQSDNLQQAGRLFFVGDVKNGNFRQTGIAVGEGIMAAMKICHCLKEAR